VIIEDLTIAVADRLTFAGSTLDRIDPLHRVTDVAVGDGGAWLGLHAVANAC
jgi:hypothetical protein